KQQISRTDERRLLRMREWLSGLRMEATVREDPYFTCPNRVDGHSSTDILDEKSALSSPALVKKKHCLLMAARYEAWVRLVHDSRMKLISTKFSLWTVCVDAHFVERRGVVQGLSP
ncbi:hypothetical protein P692DRAFT_20732395, partial [Suillus brevipes Sb2]